MLSKSFDNVDFSLGGTFDFNRDWNVLGNINITFDQIKEGKYRLIVEDNGVGLDSTIDIHNTDSFGLQLVNMLTEQLQGKFTSDVSDKTSFQVVFCDPEYPDNF